MTEAANWIKMNVTSQPVKLVLKSKTVIFNVYMLVVKMLAVICYKYFVHLCHVITRY